MSLQVFHLTRLRLAPHELVALVHRLDKEDTRVQPIFEVLYSVSPREFGVYSRGSLFSFERTPREAKALTPHERAIA